MKSILIAVFIFMVLSAQAQDTLYTRHGNIINARIIAANDTFITYKHAGDDSDGLTYTINKIAVKKVIYQNGSVENVARSNGDARPPGRANGYISYGNNVLAIIPVRINEEGIGTGLSYERTLNTKGTFSFYMPVTWVYTTPSPSPDPPHKYGAFYLEPGIKYYPTGCRGVARFSTGLSLVVAAGKRPTDIYTGDGYYIDERGNDLLMGLSVNNSLNLNVTLHSYLALDFGLGLVHSNKEFAGWIPLYHLGLRMGYRF